MSEHKSITKLSEEHKIFILEEKPLKANFFGFWHRQQVSMGEIWIRYRDGSYYDKLEPGRHIWFNGFHEWKIQRINQNIELIRIEVEGRVRGPQLDREKKTQQQEEAVPGVNLAGMGEFACEVTATLGLSCGITRFETFLRYRDPLSVFLSAVRNMVHETISALPYDQYGHWATLLRNEIKNRLKYKDSSENLIGMLVEDIYIEEIKPNTRHDRSMLEMYQQVELARRELVTAQENKKRDKVIAESYAEQGEIMNIAPSILALQNSPIGKALIDRDADLKKLMVAAGLNPGVNVQAIPDPQAQIGQSATQSMTYLQPARTSGLLPTGNAGSPIANMPPSSSISGTLQPTMNQSGPLPASSWSAPRPPQPSSIAGAGAEIPIDSIRQKQEIEELQNAGFMCAGKGQFTPDFDLNSQPIPGSRTWVIEAYASRPSGYLTLVFHCPMGYPLTAPRVQMQPPSGGGLRWIEPNTVKSWNPGCMLVSIAQEINNNIPD